MLNLREQEKAPNNYCALLKCNTVASVNCICTLKNYTKGRKEEVNYFLFLSGYIFFADGASTWSPCVGRLLPDERVGYLCTQVLLLRLLVVGWEVLVRSLDGTESWDSGSGLVVSFFASVG